MLLLSSSLKRHNPVSLISVKQPVRKGGLERRHNNIIKITGNKVFEGKGEGLKYKYSHNVLQYMVGHSTYTLIIKN